MISCTSFLRHAELRSKNLRTFSTASLITGLGNEEVSPMFYNRNPRNLEKLRIARKPSGYHLEAPGREFWHKLILNRTTKHVTAKVVHFTGSEVITASTKEWAIKKFLFGTTDASAYINLANVFAQRCLESGITEVYCDLKSQPGGKVEAFLKHLEDGGLTLSESPRFLPHRPWDVDRPEKPWEVTE